MPPDQQSLRRAYTLRRVYRGGTVKERSTSCVIVLGMHRSGTSCLTGSLQGHGLYLGDVNNAAPFNKKGNKENSQTWSINDLVLAQSDGAWDAPPKTLRWDDRACRLRAAFLSQYESIYRWGFKDPRTVLTLPFWLEALDDCQLVASFRHPLLVAKSLEQRNGFSTEHSLALWQAYNTLLLGYCREFTIPIISYDYSAQRYEDVVAQMADFLGLSSITKTTDAGFYDSSLRHQTLEGLHSDSLPHSTLPKDIADTYAELCDRAQASFSSVL